MKNILRDRSEYLRRPLVLDGAMGSLLQMRGIPVNGPLWSATANLLFPEEVINIHKSYIEAGADIITTNTFRTNPLTVKLSRINQSSTELVEHAIRLAKKAAKENNVIIAGSNAPAEDCYKKKREISPEQLYKNHSEHIELLYHNGVDIIWNETFSHLDEIRIVCEYCSSKDISFVINLFVDNNLHLLSGESISETLSLINDYNPSAIGVNCVSMDTFFNLMKDKISYHSWGFYLNCGSGIFTDPIIETGIYPAEYSSGIREYLNSEPLYVGSCCGSTPEHTQHIKELFLEIFTD